MRFALAMIEFASLERGQVAGWGEVAMKRFDRWELFERLETPFRHRGREFRLVIGEEKKGRRRSEVLSLKKHRRVRAEEQQRRQRAESARVGQGLQALAARGVCDLIVILEKTNQTLRRQMRGRSSAPVFLPRVVLPLIQKSKLRHRDEFLRRAAVVGVVRLAAPSRRDHRRVMPVVIPERVEAVLVDQLRLLRLVLADDENLFAV